MLSPEEESFTIFMDMTATVPVAVCNFFASADLEEL